MLYLSQAIGRPVRDQHGEPIGTVADLIVAIGDRYPPVTGIVVKTNGREIFLHWNSVTSLDAGGATLGTSAIDITKFQQRPNEIRLKLDLMDRQIVDIDGRKVVRVNDLRLDEVEGALHLVAVDVGASGLLRRLGIEGPWRTIAHGLGRGVPERYIDWEDVDPVERTIASVKLRVPHKGLAELHPADLATIMDQLSRSDRVGVIEALDDEAAADAIGEMEPETQVDILEDLEPGRAADILEEMDPDEAADLVADLSEESREEILGLMEKEEADEVQELMTYGEETAGGIMTTEFVAVPATLTAGQTIDRLRELEPDAETIYYVYVTDEDGRLCGVLSLRDLIVAKPNILVSACMYPEPVAVRTGASQEEVTEVVARYNLLAVPVVDEEGRLEGIVTVDDAIDTLLPQPSKRRLPRLFSRSGGGER
jgi:flagellar motility protein MotE (MotC chaperone)/sporulation protein YlmC with PRC-barrel domain